MRVSIKLKANNNSLKQRGQNTIPSIDPNQKNKIVSKQIYNGWLTDKESVKYHYKFSTYNHSGIIGGSLDPVFKNIIFKSGVAEIKLSSLNQEFMTDVLMGITRKPIVEAGDFYFDIVDVTKMPFSNEETEVKFFTISPIFMIAKEEVDGKRKHFTFKDDDKTTSSMMTNTLKNRILELDMNIDIKGLEVHFDSSYKKAKEKLIVYPSKKHELLLHASSCPVIIKGNPKAIEAAYHLGIGHSTGAGFGCIETWKTEKTI